jgi:HEAT repeat protein
MFRTARRIAPLLESLILGAVTVTAASVAATALVGCADENEPETWVKRLDDVAQRPAAITRLVQFFEDAMTKDNKDRGGPSVKPLLDKIIDPMTKTCVAGDLDEKTQSKLVKFISDARDPRGADCLVKALKDFKPEVNEEDVRWAARAVGPMDLKQASGPLLEVFVKLRPSKLKKVPELYRDVHDALVDLKDPAWEGQLIQLLNRPINDRKDVQNLRDEVYWQTTAAELLGILKSKAAVKPLIKTILSPMKADIAATSVSALIKIGKDAVAPTIALLKSEDKELVDYSTAENLKGAGAGGDAKATEAAKKTADKAHIGVAAIILASIGREEAAQPMIDAMGSVDDLSRAIIARELVKLPKTPEIVKAFQAAYEKTPTTLSIPPGAGASESLLDAAGTFFDASFVPWFVKTAMALKGDADDVDPIRAQSLVTAMKVMTADQTAEVEKLYNAKANGPDGKPSILGKAYEKEWKMSKDLLSACGDKSECYLAKLAEPKSQSDDGQFQGIKSAYMVGVYGSPDVRQKLIDMMPKLTNAAVRFVAVQVIDRFSPKGDTAIAAKLQKIVDDGEASKDSNKMAANAPFKTVIYRLNARAQ